MHDFTSAIALHECVVLGVEFRALNMLSKCSRPPPQVHIQPLALEWEEGSRKG